MFDPRTTERVRELLSTEPNSTITREDGPLPVPSLSEIFGRSQHLEGERLRQHLLEATPETVEPRLCVYSYDPPAGFHYTVVDPATRCAISFTPDGLVCYLPEPTVAIHPDLLMVVKRLRPGQDKTPEGYVREVPFSELLDRDR